MEGRIGDGDSAQFAQRSLHTHAGAQLRGDADSARAAQRSLHTHAGVQRNAHVEVVALGNASEEHNQIAPSPPSVPNATSVV